VITRGDDTVITRGDDPPYPPMSAPSGLIAKTAIVSGPPERTRTSRGTTLRHPKEATR
jgi:hypothetical protein